MLTGANMLWTLSWANSRRRKKNSCPCRESKIGLCRTPHLTNLNLHNPLQYRYWRFWEPGLRKSWMTWRPVLCVREQAVWDHCLQTAWRSIAEEMWKLWWALESAGSELNWRNWSLSPCGMNWRKLDLKANDTLQTFQATFHSTNLHKMRTFFSKSDFFYSRFYSVECGSCGTSLAALFSCNLVTNPPGQNYELPGIVYLIRTRPNFVGARKTPATPVIYVKPQYYLPPGSILWYHCAGMFFLREIYD